MMYSGLSRIMARVVLILAALFLSGSCSNEILEALRAHVEEANTPLEPVIEVSRGAVIIDDSDTVDFGSQPTGSDTDITFSIKNSGTGNLLLQTPEVVPSSLTDGFSTHSLSGTSIPAGSSENLVLRFHPSSGGTHDATVTLSSNAINEPALEFSLTGAGVVPDTEDPTGSVSIDGGATYSTDTSVNLSISASDTGGGTVQSMEIRNDTAFTGNWLPYSTSQAWSLNGPDGTDTVFIRFQDNSGNISDTYSDTIILDRVPPSITGRSPASGASNVSRTSNVTVSFSEDIDQSTWESAVSLSIKGGSEVDIDPDSDTDEVWLMPTSNLLYGYDYSISVTSGITDLAGNALSNPGTTDFTVERDIWEGSDGNNLPDDAYRLDDLIPGYYMYNWFDLVPDEQHEDGWSVPTGAHSTLAVLEGYDYYVIDPPDDAYLMNIRVLFTSDESHGETLDAAGDDVLSLSAWNNGQSYGAFLNGVESSTANDVEYELDLSGRTGDFLIGVSEDSYDYSNRRSYNLQILLWQDM